MNTTTDAEVTHEVDPTVSEHERERSGVMALAQWYMQRKGHGEAVPTDVMRLPELPCWYLSYDLAEGELELEVYYVNPVQGWQTKVTTFASRDQRDSAAALEQDARAWARGRAQALGLTSDKARAQARRTALAEIQQEMDAEAHEWAQGRARALAQAKVRAWLRTEREASEPAAS